MAYETPGITLSIAAGVDLSASQFVGVTIDSTGRAVLPAAGGSIAGVNQSAPILNDGCTLQIDGYSKMICSAALAAGAQVMVDAAGKALAATATNYIIGVVVVGTANPNEIATVLLQNRGKM